jgi:hypothetical protein
VVEGEPIRVSVCHCLACQRRTGSAFSAQARFPLEAVTIAGESREFERISDEGEGRRFNFCPRCGATVYYQTDPELIAIPLGAFAGLDFPPPTVSVWEERKHAWVNSPPGAQRIN